MGGVESEVTAANFPQGKSASRMWADLYDDLRGGQKQVLRRRWRFEAGNHARLMQLLTECAETIPGD
jgi:hypothetical protein